MEIMTAGFMLLSGGTLLVSAGVMIASALSARRYEKRLRNMESLAAEWGKTLNRHEALISEMIWNDGPREESDCPTKESKEDKEDEEKNLKWLEGLHNVLAYEPKPRRGGSAAGREE